MIYYKITSRYVFEPRVEDFAIKPSTSADGWKYHKPSKKRKKNKR